MNNDRDTVRDSKARSRSHCLRPAGGAKARLPKADWVSLYTERVLKAWQRQAAPLSPTAAYADHIRKTLACFYSEPLKRAFIEQTYRHHVSAQ